MTSLSDRKDSLTPRNPTDIEIMEETLMTFHVNIRNQYCPVKVLVHYNDKKVKGVARNDLKVYCSLTKREPTENDCFRSFVNVRKPYLVTHFSLIALRYQTASIRSSKLIL